MSFLKKALIVSTGIPMRPTTKKNRYSKKSMKELKKQTALMEAAAKRGR